MLKRFLRVTDVPFSASIGLLALRVVIGVAFMFHGWGKIQAPFSWMPPGAPVPGFLQALAALSEFGGGLAWILGLLTPLASLGIAVTMAVAVAMHVSGGDPFFAMGGPAYESAAVYLGISLALLLVGPGRLSVDAAVFGTKR
jgi:putative oxidoreductase